MVAAPAASEAGEDEVAVFVVIAAGVQLGEGEVRAWCDKRLPAFARPEYVEIVDALPMTPSGKVRKIELREMAAERARAVAS
jgi:crotonobetaine/carnitine-CoA ligase